MAARVGFRNLDHREEHRSEHRLDWRMEMNLLRRAFGAFADALDLRGSGVST